MSTKITIASSNTCRLYEEVLENDSIYLELRDIAGCCFEIWERHDEQNPNIHSTVIVKIPLKEWKELIKKFIEKEETKK